MSTRLENDWNLNWMKKDNLICELCYLKEPDMFMISDNQTAYPKICMDCKEIILQQEGSVDDFKFIEIKWYNPLHLNVNIFQFKVKYLCI